MAKITLNSLADMKRSGQKITCLTAYDATFAQLACSQGIDVLLVGDSLGMVCQGLDSTLPVTVADMCYHTRSVARGTTNALVMADLPFASYATPEQALDNSAQLMRAGAEVVKLEGEAWLAPLVTRLRQQGIPSCVHLGLTPQSVNVFGGYKVQGRQMAQAQAMIQAATALEEAGAAMLLLECVPVSLAREITAAVSIPVIGIGAGVDTDGQILVVYDMLGLTCGRKPRFVMDFMAAADSPQEAVSAYAAAVRAGQFPAREHCFE